MSCGKIGWFRWHTRNFQGHMKRHYNDVRKSLTRHGIVDSPTGQALMLGEIEQRLRALGWRSGRDRRHHAARGMRGRSVAVGAKTVMSEGAKVPGAIRTSLGRLVDVDSGRPLTSVELRRRLAAAGFDEHQVAREVALAIERDEVTNEKPNRPM
jgi:hypothetical protein